MKDVETNLPLFQDEADIEEATAALLKSYESDEETPSDEDEENPDAEEGEQEVVDDSDGTQEDEDHDDADQDEDDAEEPEVTEEDDAEEADEDSDTAEPLDVDDDAEVEVTVNGKVERVSIGALKRLAGQEASLTQKTQAVAEQRRALEAQGAYVAKVMSDRYEAAKANAARYANVDLYRASRELDTAEFEALKEAKESAEAEVAALEREGSEFLQKTQETRKALLREQAKESLKVITKNIPDWSDKLYDEVRSYAVSQGMDSQMVNEVVDPGAIMMMHKAMLYDRAQSASAKVTKKVTKASKKTVRKSDTPADTKASKIKALQRDVMSNGGDVEDVTALFLAASEE